MEKKELEFWDYLLWGGGFIILIWALLKIFKIISSPIWVDMVPVVAGGLSLLGGAYKLGKIMNGVEDTGKKVNELLVMKDDFQKVRHNQNLCITGKLHDSPYRKKF